MGVRRNGESGVAQKKNDNVIFALVPGGRWGESTGEGCVAKWMRLVQGIGPPALEPELRSWRHLIGLSIGRSRLSIPRAASKKMQPLRTGKP